MMNKRIAGRCCAWLLAAGILAAGGPAWVGCVGLERTNWDGWATHYDEAERLQARSRRAMLIYYKHRERDRNEATSAALKNL